MPWYGSLGCTPRVTQAAIIMCAIMCATAPTAFGFVAKLSSSNHITESLPRWCVLARSRDLDDNGIIATRIRGGDKKQLEMAMMDKNFLAGFRFFSRQTRPCINEDSAIIDYGASRETAQKSLHNQYNNRLFAVLRHRQNLLMAKEIQSKSINNEFSANPNEERGHADLIAGCPVHGEFNGSPDASVSRGQTESEYAESDMLYNIIREYRIKKRIAIDGYRDIVQYFNVRNPMMQRLMKGLPSLQRQQTEER